jgi:hypothetical protein
MMGLGRPFNRARDPMSPHHIAAAAPEARVPTPGHVPDNGAKWRGASLTASGRRAAPATATT